MIPVYRAAVCILWVMSPVVAPVTKVLSAVKNLTLGHPSTLPVERKRFKVGVESYLSLYSTAFITAEGARLSFLYFHLDGF